MRSRSYLLGLLLTAGLLGTPTWAGEPSTSPNYKTTVRSAAERTRALDVLITFSEFPLETHISKQYADKGIIFGGDDPFITGDLSNPTAPVLSGTPKYLGAIEGKFVRSDGNKATVRRFKMDAGYFDEKNSVKITLFNKKREVVLTVKNNQLGIQTFDFKDLPQRVHRFRIEAIGSEPHGFAIDNVAFKERE